MIPLKRCCLVSSVAMTTANRPGPGITLGSWQIKEGKKKVYVQVCVNVYCMCVCVCLFKQERVGEKNKI